MSTPRRGLLVGDRNDAAAIRLTLRPPRIARAPGPTDLDPKLGPGRRALVLPGFHAQGSPPGAPDMTTWAIGKLPGRDSHPLDRCCYGLHQKTGLSTASVPTERLAPRTGDPPCEHINVSNVDRAAYAPRDRSDRGYQRLQARRSVRANRRSSRIRDPPLASDTVQPYAVTTRADKHRRNRSTIRSSRGSMGGG